MRRLLDDDLIASLLLVHGLHPDDVHTRVATALDSVRPYLGSHGGDVRLLDVTAGVVSLELTGSCRSCPSSSVTLELAVEDAVRSAAPEIESIEVVAAQSGAEPAVIAPDSLFAHVRSAGSWVAVPELEGLAAGEVGGFEVAGFGGAGPAGSATRPGNALPRPLVLPARARWPVPRCIAVSAGDPVLRCPQLPRALRLLCTPVRAWTGRLGIWNRCRCWCVRESCRSRCRWGWADEFDRARAAPPGDRSPTAGTRGGAVRDVRGIHCRTASARGRRGGQAVDVCVPRGLSAVHSSPDAALRYRAVPQRYTAFREFTLSQGEWDGSNSRSAWCSCCAVRPRGGPSRCESGPGRSHRIRTATAELAGDSSNT